MNNKQLKMYNQNGFVLKEFFNKKEHELIFNFGINWFYKICKIKKKDASKYPIHKYHIWSKKIGIDHPKICSAKNRYIYPPIKIQQIRIK